jgi:steroid delta-isomerase-like uncharacterized protein
MVTDAVADFVASATLVAVTAKLPAVFPAAYNPVVEIVPLVALHVTAAFEVPDTVAENCWDIPSAREADVGAIATPTEGHRGFGDGDPPDWLAEPTHPTRLEANKSEEAYPMRGRRNRPERIPDSYPGVYENTAARRVIIVRDSPEQVNGRREDAKLSLGTDLAQGPQPNRGGGRHFSAAEGPQLFRVSLLLLQSFESRLSELLLLLPPGATGRGARTHPRGHRNQPFLEEDSLMSVSPKEVIRRLYTEVWNERRLEVVDQLFSQSHALISPSVSGPAVGPAAYKNQMASFVAGFPDLRFVVEETISENDKIVVSWSLTGTHNGEFLGIAPTNHKVSFTGITIHQIVDGKILDSQATWDAISVFQQLGVELPLNQGRRVASTR